MIFRPRIFISSTLNENLSIRKEIEEFYTSVGAEPMLYEKNLTPSVAQASYRSDILDADFIIFIIKSQYGTVTLDTGLSGTHEEFRIALSMDIPKHVYIKKTANEDVNQQLKQEIESQQISYYYFEDDKELLSRIKETTFTIAKEIMLRKVENMVLPKQSARKISVNYDYMQAVEILKVVRLMQDFSNKIGLDYVTTTLFGAFIDPVANRQQMEDGIFNDKMLESKLNNMLAVYYTFCQTYGLDYTAKPEYMCTYQIPVLGEICITRCQAVMNPNVTYEGYCALINQFFLAVDDFRNYVSQMRIELDTQTL